MHMRRSIPAFLAMIAILLFISACGSNSSSPSSLSAGQVLTNTASVMKQLKTVHLNMTLAATVGVTGLATPTTGSSTPSNFTFNFKGSGDEVLPDQTSLQLSLNGFGNNYNFAVITKGQQVYIQNKQGQWYVIDKSKLSGSGSSSNPLSGASIPDFGKVLDLAQKNGKVTDHGDETLNGVSLRHITVTLDKNGIEQLLKSSGQLNGLTGASQQTFDKLFSSAKDLNASLDFWIDESTSYIHRFEMKFNLNLDFSQFVTPTPGTTTSPKTASVKFDMTIDLSKFNDSSIKISAPANPIPTDNPGVIFGSGA